METTTIKNGAATGTSLKSIFTVLKFTYGLVPIVAGADKFMNLLTQWSQYLHPCIAGAIDPHAFMMIVGVIEIVAGIIVLIRPQIGGIVVSLWLVLIALNLIVAGHFFDVAVRDLVMAIGAFSMWRLSRIVQ